MTDTEALLAAAIHEADRHTGALPHILCNDWARDILATPSGQQLAVYGPCSLDTPNPRHEHADGYACGIVAARAALGQRLLAPTERERAAQARQLHDSHDLHHKAGAWPASCLGCGMFRLLAAQPDAPEAAWHAKEPDPTSNEFGGGSTR